MRGKYWANNGKVARLGGIRIQFSISDFSFAIFIGAPEKAKRAMKNGKLEMTNGKSCLYP